ncbi:MAG: hypothetical protein AB7G28_05330 [Pirellulales bacterium]
MHAKNLIETVVVVAIAFAAPFAIAAEPTVASTAPPKTVTIDGQTLDLAWQGGTEDAPIYEYIPQGETLEHWTHLASIREYHSIDDAKSLAEGTVQAVKQDYPGAPTQLVENPNNGDVMIDFLVGPPDGSFVEYNIFQYSKRPAGGTVAQQYALRAYGDTSEFLKNLESTRGRLLNEMADHGLESK